MKELRPFEDLIKPIEIDGETFVPIEEIAIISLAPKIINLTGYSCSNISKKGFAWLLYEYMNKDNDFVENFTIYIYLDFNIECFLNDGGTTHKNIFHKNQVQIVKNLIKWGFVEP